MPRPAGRCSLFLLFASCLGVENENGIGLAWVLGVRGFDAIARGESCVIPRTPERGVCVDFF